MKTNSMEFGFHSWNPCYSWFKSRLDRNPFGEHVDDLLLVGELARLQFRVEQLAVGEQLETAAPAGDEFQVGDLLLERGQDLRRQTDGFWFVVSDRAEFQDQVHV